MKQIWPNYSYSPTTNVLTLTGLNIDRDQLLLVTAADRGRIMYNFADSSVTASAFTSGANTALTLVATTAGLTTTAALVIYYDDQVAGISGTVTANAGGDFGNSIENVYDVGNVTKKIAVQLYDDAGSAIGIGINPLPVSGTVTASLSNYFLFASDGGGAQPDNGIQLGFSTETSAGEDYVRVAPSNPLPVSVENSVNINSLPAIRINPNYNGQDGNNGPVVEADSSIGYDPRYMVFAGGLELTSLEYRGLTFVSNGLLVAGTVTVGSALPTGTNRIGVVTIGAGTVTIGAGTAQIGSVTASISGTVPISISSVTVGNSVTIGSLPAISGTVTANSSNGSLTTRFGSVTTANTAFATSAVTNANRKYLLIQNITTASNAITVGIGFTPTTTQGILLSSGAGITFEGSYIPTGAVNLLSSVTASCFTILEA